MQLHRHNAHAFDLLAQRHDASAFACCDPYTTRVAELLALYLPPYPTLHILDLGGGSGNWATRLAAQGHHVTLTDISFEMLRHAQQHLNASNRVKLVCMDAATPALRPGQWDVFLAIGDLLSYLRDPTSALNTLRDIARPSTLFLGTVISRFGLATRQLRVQNFSIAKGIIETGLFTERTIDELSQIAASQQMAAPRAPLQLHSHTAAELSALLTNTGMEILSIQGINILRCIAETKAELWSQSDLLSCDRWLAIQDPWRDFSTNLFFAARWRS